MHKVLLIEDNPGDARLIREMVAEAPFTMHCADRLAKGLEHLSATETALVILDLTLPDSMGLDTFAKVYAHAPAVPIIVLTGNDDDALALSAVAARVIHAEALWVTVDQDATLFAGLSGCRPAPRGARH